MNTAESLQSTGRMTGVVGRDGAPIDRDVGFLKSLHRFVANREEGLEERLGDLLDAAAGRLGMEVGMLAMIEDVNYEVLEAVCPDGELEAGDVFDLSDTFCSETVKSKEPIAFCTIEGTSWEQHAGHKTFGFESYIGSQIRLQNEVIGTLSFARYEPRGVAIEDEDLLVVKLLSEWISGEFERNLIQEKLSSGGSVATPAKSAPKPKAEPEPPAAPAGLGFRILIVDADDGNRLKTEKALLSLGCRVQTATDGLSALTQIGAEWFDFILLDLDMPLKDCMDLATSIRSAEEDLELDKRMHIVGLYTHLIHQIRDACEASGIDLFVEKPLSNDKLKAALTSGKK